jgi:hypothetical protein
MKPRKRWQMPEFKVQREYTNWDEITVEAKDKEEALRIAEEDWEEYNYITCSSYDYTGEFWVGEADE